MNFIWDRLTKRGKCPSKQAEEQTSLNKQAHRLTNKNPNFLDNNTVVISRQLVQASNMGNLSAKLETQFFFLRL